MCNRYVQVTTSGISQKQHERNPMRRIRDFLASLTDHLEHVYEEHIMKRFVGTFLVLTFLVMIALIEVNRRATLPEPFAAALGNNHFLAVEIVFTLLLFTEVVSLIFSLTRSFSRSIGIQLEILSLILLRDTFKKFKDFGEPLQWELVADNIGSMIADASGSLAIFVILGVYYRQLERRPITEGEKGVDEFIEDKKLIALSLIAIFTVIGVFDVGLLLTGGETYPFFETFYTVLIFTDVLMVLLSLRYSTVFGVTFRNFAFSVVTVFIRLALIAPVPLNAGIGVGVALFALGVAVAYNRYGREIEAQHESEAQESAVASTSDAV
jgi:hypothetical protein